MLSSDVLGPFVALAVIVILVVLWYAREGRNPALETYLEKNEFGPPLSFHGTLAVEEFRPSARLRLCKSTKEARYSQIWYRLVGVGRQARFDEVTFDGSTMAVQLKKKNKDSVVNFSSLSAIRMREVAGGRGGGSYWHVELVPQKGRPTPFITSQPGDRKGTFENAAPVAKAAAEIANLPVQSVRCGQCLDCHLGPTARKTS